MMNNIINSEAAAVDWLKDILPGSCWSDELIALVHNFPNAIHVQDEDGLPLHCTCLHGCIFEIIECLFKLWPESVLKVTADGNLPLHYACYRTLPLPFIQFWPNAIHKHNNSGQLLWHYACSYGSMDEVIEFLFDCLLAWSNNAHYPGNYPLYLVIG